MRQRVYTVPTILFAIPLRNHNDKNPNTADLPHTTPPISVHRNYTGTSYPAQNINAIMISQTTILSVLFFLFVSCLEATVTPVQQRPQILKHDKLDTSLGLKSSSPSISKTLAGRQITPKSPADVGGITRTRLGYAQTSGVAGGIVIPAQAGVTFTFNMEGKISLEGVLSSEIQDTTDNLVLKYSSDFQSWYSKETKSLKSRAGGGFFSFFQAAASYGYTKNTETEKVLQSDEFKKFSEEAGGILKSTTTQLLEGEFAGAYSGVSIGSGRQEVVSVFGYIFISQITLDSGEIFNVVQNNPALVTADQNGNIINDNTTTVPIKPSITDNIIDITIGGRR